MAETCHRSGMKVYAADNPIRVGGLVFHPGHFTCKATGVKLKLNTYVIGSDGDVYLKGKEPWVKPNQVTDVITERVAAVPDSNMRTTDRKFNVAGKAKARGATDEDQGSNYGAGAVVVETQTSVVKPPTTVNNINQMEKRHNGTDQYTGASGDAPAE